MQRFRIVDSNVIGVTPMDNATDVRLYARESRVEQHAVSFALKRERSFQEAWIFVSLDATRFGRMGYSTRATAVFKKGTNEHSASISFRGNSVVW